MDISFLFYFLAKGLEISSPIAFAALGGVFSERGGVVNIALEGIMSVTALTLVWGAIAFQSVWVGLFVAILTGVLMSLIHAVVTITFRVWITSSREWPSTCFPSGCHDSSARASSVRRRSPRSTRTCSPSSSG